MNQKDLRIEKLWRRGVKNPEAIAKKLGFSGPALQKGIDRVLEGLKRLKLS